MLCDDDRCDAAGCGARPTLFRCWRCGIAAMITHCQHNEPVGPIAVSLTTDYPNQTCNPCEFRQETLSDLATRYLGADARGADLTRFRRALNAALVQPCLTRYAYDCCPTSHAAQFVWNGGNWRVVAAALLKPC
jgi:hypothetical protein